MRADPEPDKVFAVSDGEGSPGRSDPNGPEPPCLFQMKGRMERIVLQDIEISIGYLSHMRRKRIVAFPERGGRVMLQRRCARPAKSSDRASSASVSSFPDVASVSKRSSQRFACRSSNQRVNSASSSADSSITDFSICSRRLITVSDFARRLGHASVAAKVVLHPISMNRSTSTSPLSEILRCGMTGRGRKASWRKGS